MIECNSNTITIQICEEKTEKTSDIINPMEFRKGSSSSSHNGSINKSNNTQSHTNQNQQQTQLNTNQTIQQQILFPEENANNQQNVEFRRPRNKSFAKVLNKRQQIREKFKNDFFSGKKSPLRSPTKQDNIPKVEPFGEVVQNKVDETKDNQLQQEQSIQQQNNQENNNKNDNIVINKDENDTTKNPIQQQQIQNDETATTQINIINSQPEEKSENKKNIFEFEEVDVELVEPIFLRIESKTDKEDIEKDMKNNIFHITRNGQIPSFESIYELQDILGEGCVGLVKKAFKISDQQYYAVKIVRTRDEETIMNIKNEFLHLRELKHKNIVKVYEIYIDKTKGKIYSVMELIQGREMFEVINQLGSYSEEIAKKIFKQIVNAISYMHSQYVCHRDLKPNNILCDETGENVKITDFNVSKFCDSYKDYNRTSLPFQGIKMWTYTGTIAFSAPELFKENCYDENIDIWSAGVILYTMLCGKEPFQAEFVKDLIHKIIEGEYSFPSDPWDKISEDAKDLIKKCLTINPEDRIKPNNMLSHPWLQEQKIQEHELDRNQLVENLDRLVKGRTSSFEKKQNRRRRSNTLHTQLMTCFKSSDYMFSNKCFDNPTHTEEENSDDQEDDTNKRNNTNKDINNINKNKNIVNLNNINNNNCENQSPMRAVSLTLQQRPNNPNLPLFDIDLFTKQNEADKQKIFMNQLDQQLNQISFLKDATNKFNDLNIFPNRTTSYDIMSSDQIQSILNNNNSNSNNNSNNSPTKIQLQSDDNKSNN